MRYKYETEAGDLDNWDDDPPPWDGEEEDDDDDGED